MKPSWGTHWSPSTLHVENLKSEVIPGYAARFCLKSKEITEKTPEAKLWVKENEGGRLQVLAAPFQLLALCAAVGGQL